MITPMLLPILQKDFLQVNILLQGRRLEATSMHMQSRQHARLRCIALHSLRPADFTTQLPAGIFPAIPMQMLVFLLRGLCSFTLHACRYFDGRCMQLLSHALQILCAHCHYIRIRLPTRFCHYHANVCCAAGTARYPERLLKAGQPQESLNLQRHHYLAHWQY
jgi:hypothetical protein